MAASHSARSVVLIGNTGVGKSYLLNQMLNEERFESGVNIEGVTTQLECATITEFVEPVTLLNIPGLVEACAENVQRNQRVLQEALSKGGEYKLVFIFAAGVAGRVQPKDIFAYQEVCKGYDLPKMPIIMNNLQLNLKPEENKDEKLHQYWAKLVGMLKGLGVQSECQVIEQGAAREDILRKLHAATETFPWQKMPAAQAMNFNEYAKATQEAMQKNELQIRGLAKQLNDNQEEMRRLIANNKAQEERQRASFEQQMATLNQNLRSATDRVWYAERDSANAQRELSSMQSRASSLESSLQSERRRREEACETSERLSAECRQLRNRSPEIRYVYR